MAVRKLTTGLWLCEFYPVGRSGRRVPKQFATKGLICCDSSITQRVADSKTRMDGVAGAQPLSASNRWQPLFYRRGFDQRGIALRVVGNWVKDLVKVLHRPNLKPHHEAILPGDFVALGTFGHLLDKLLHIVQLPRQWLDADNGHQRIPQSL